MAFFDRFRRNPGESEERSAVWPGFPLPPSQFAVSANPSVQAVTLESSLRHAATWACQRILVSTIAKMPFNAVRFVDDVPIDRRIQRLPELRIASERIIRTLAIG